MKTNFYYFAILTFVPDGVEGDVNMIHVFSNEAVITMQCPCGCGAYIELPTVGDSPKWSYTVANDKISITPSIQRTVGCMSHFTITNGNVINNG